MSRQAKLTVVPAAAATLAVVLLIVGIVQSQRAWAAANVVDPPTAMEVASTMHRCGLEPETLAAAGIDATGTTALVGRFITSFVANEGALVVADDNVATWRRESDRLRRLIRSGREEDGDVAALQAAEAALATAEASRDAVLDTLIDDAEDGLSDSARLTLSSIRANARPGLPMHFNVVAWDDAGFVSLRDTLSIIRIAEDQGETPPIAVTDRLDDWEAIPAVSTAAARLNVLLPAVTAAWETATGLSE